LIDNTYLNCLLGNVEGLSSIASSYDPSLNSSSLPGELIGSSLGNYLVKFFSNDDLIISNPDVFIPIIVPYVIGLLSYYISLTFCYNDGDDKKLAL
jgi:hypothetical protein